MCESNVYLAKAGKEELIFKEVVKILPEGADEFVLMDILGKSQRVKGRIKEMNLLGHKIVIEAVE